MIGRVRENEIIERSWQFLGAEIPAKKIYERRFESLAAGQETEKHVSDREDKQTSIKSMVPTFWLARRSWYVCAEKTY